MEERVKTLANFTQENPMDSRSSLRNSTPVAEVDGCRALEVQDWFMILLHYFVFRWGRWNDIISTTRFKRRLGEKDIEAISRTMVSHVTHRI